MAMIEKATYIKGLCDGLELDAKSKEGKAIAALVDLVTEMAEALDDMACDIYDLHDYIEELDEDLGDVESLVYELDEDDDECCCGDCDCCDEDCDLCDEDDEMEFFAIECPSCGELIHFDSSIDPEDLTCPACGENVNSAVEADDLKKTDGADA